MSRCDSWQPHQFLYVARQHAAESPKLSSFRAARRQPAIFTLGSWQTSNALALQASLCGSVIHRLHQFQLRETRPKHRDEPHKLIQVGVTPTPASHFRIRSSIRGATRCLREECGCKSHRERQFHRSVAQSLERPAWDREAAGENPAIPTISDRCRG